MRKLLATGVGVAAAFGMVLGAGSAGANNEFEGWTYARVTDWAAQQGASIRIGTREGSYLPTEQCVVTGNRKLLSNDSSGRSRGYTYLLDLNCNDTSALNGHPGNSVATEAGRNALKARETAKTLSDDYVKATEAGKTAACFAGDPNTRYCVKVCTESKACSSELNEALGL